MLDFNTGSLISESSSHEFYSSLVINKNTTLLYFFQIRINWTGSLVCLDNEKLTFNYLTGVLSSLMSPYNSPAMQEIQEKQIWSLEKEIPTHSSILAWEISWKEEPGGLQSMGSQQSDLTWQLNHSSFSSVQFSHSVMSDSLRPHESQHARPPCPSPTSEIHSDSCPSSRWCHPAISSSAIHFSSCPQSLPASGSFPMSQLCMRWPKYWSFSFSISPSNEHPELISFRMDWLDLLAIQGTLKSLLQHHSSKASILQRSAFFTVQLSHPYMTTGKTIALTRRIMLAK